MTVYVSNAFSLNMLRHERELILIYPEDIKWIKRMLSKGFVSAVGHESTAKLLSQLLGIEIPVNRIEIKIEYGDKLIVFQLLQRLPEGKVLSEEELRQVKYRFLVVEPVVGEVM